MLLLILGQLTFLLIALKNELILLLLHRKKHSDPSDSMADTILPYFSHFLLYVFSILSSKGTINRNIDTHLPLTITMFEIWLHGEIYSGIVLRFILTV